MVEKKTLINKSNKKEETNIKKEEKIIKKDWNIEEYTVTKCID